MSNGMVLREIVTRFKWESDEQSAKKVERRVTGLKKGIGGIGKLFGISLGIVGAKALFSLGQNAARAQFMLRNLAGTEFKGLRQNMMQIRRDLDSVRQGAGKVFRTRDFDVAAAGYVRVFGRGRRELELFEQIFRSAAKQSAITGENVVQLVQKLTGAVQSGDFSALMDFPGIDQAFVKRLQDINAILDPGEIGGQAAIRRNAQELSRSLRLIADEQTRSLRNVPGQLLEADSAATRLQNGIDRLAKTINEKLIPVLESMNTLLDRMNQLTGGGDASAGGIFDEIGEFAFQPLKQKAVKAKRDRMLRQFMSGRTPGANFPPDIVAEGQRRQALSAGAEAISVQNTFHINGADPNAVAREVSRLQAKTFSDARKNVIPTEDR